MNTVVFFGIFILFKIGNSQNLINVGILIPSDSDYVLHRDCGMYNSLGAIPMAIDRIVEEELLDNFNFTWVILLTFL